MQATPAATRRRRRRRRRVSDEEGEEKEIRHTSDMHEQTTTNACGPSASAGAAAASMSPLDSLAIAAAAQLSYALPIHPPRRRKRIADADEEDVDGNAAQATLELQLPAFRPVRVARLNPPTAHGHASPVPMEIDADDSRPAGPVPLLPPTPQPVAASVSVASQPSDSTSAAASPSAAPLPTSPVIIDIDAQEQLDRGSAKTSDAASGAACSFAARKMLQAAARPSRAHGAACKAAAVCAAPVSAAAKVASSFIQPPSNSSTYALPRCVPWQSSIKARRRMRQQKEAAMASAAAAGRVAAGSFGKRISSGCGPLVALRVIEVLDDEIALLEATRKPAEIVDLTDDMEPPPSQPPPVKSPHQASAAQSDDSPSDSPILWTNSSDDSDADSDAYDSADEVDSLNGSEKEHKSPSVSPMPSSTRRRQTCRQQNSKLASPSCHQAGAEPATVQLQSPPSSPLPPSSRLKRLRRAWEPPREPVRGLTPPPAPAAEIQEIIMEKQNLPDVQHEVPGSDQKEDEREAKEEQPPQAAAAPEQEINQHIPSSPAADGSVPQGQAEGQCSPHALGVLHSDPSSYPLPWLNDLTSSPPPPYRHLSGGCEVSDAVAALDDYDSMFRGCHCSGMFGCTLQCPCRLRGAAGYDRAGRLSWTALEGLSLWECSGRCGCDPHKCRNRVVQRAGSVNRALPMYVFRHEEQGWGVRCSEPIPKGAYIGEYLGVLLDESACTQEDVSDEFMFSVSTASIHPDDVTELKALLLQEEEAESVGAGTQSDLIDQLLQSMPRVTVDAQHAGNITRCRQTTERIHQSLGLDDSCKQSLLREAGVLRPLQILTLSVYTENRSPNRALICYFALTDISPLEDLTVDYHYERNPRPGGEWPFVCLCHSASCQHPAWRVRNNHED